MDKFTAHRTQSEVVSNDPRNRSQDESVEQVRTLTDLEMRFVGGGDDIPSWGKP